MEDLTKKQKIWRSVIVVLAIVLLCLSVFLFLKLTGLYEKVNSPAKIKSLILGAGIYGRVTFVLLQFLQVTFLPIPSTITTLAGVLIYGPFQSALLSFAGILLGSAFAFYIGDRFGKKLVEFMVGKQTCKKWTQKLSRAKYTFFVMMLLPFFPTTFCV